jgi:hypothetical protein
VSKIFPAGFGWQYGSIIASDLGYTANDVGFAALTGLGDMTGVAVGHIIYYGVKSLLDPSISVKQEVQIGTFLGSAAFCSGFIWQPSVNFFQGLDVPFMGVSLGTWAVCGAAFFGGLRLFRSIYSPFLAIAPADKENLVHDALLSTSIGGASGGFVGTDVNYMGGEGNFLRPFVGVEATDSALSGCVKAGSATSLGFLAAQSAQNVTYPANVKNWTD